MSLASEDRHIFTYTEAKNQLIPGSCAKWVKVTADTAKAHEENCKEAEKETNTTTWTHSNSQTSRYQLTRATTQEFLLVYG